MILDPVELSKILVAEQTVTPVTESGFSSLKNILSQIGFDCNIMNFSDNNTPDVSNLFARTGKKGKNLCFAGHLDVVPTGDKSLWNKSPFEAYIDNGIFYGRGASDMKCAIACFISAVSKYQNLNKSLLNDGTISLLITGDEEGPAINGSKKMLQQLTKQNINFDACIVGEPTCSKFIGDTIKIGRRGSITFYITIIGKQGHVAYPHLALNPVPVLTELMQYLNNFTLDNGNSFFDPSNLEIVNLKAGENADNVIPQTANATVNIRFNNLHTGESIIKWIEVKCEELKTKYNIDYKLNHFLSGEAFVTNAGNFSDIVSKATQKVIGYTPSFSTSGGTSDARFIKDYCPVVELGMLNSTAHKINEHVKVEDIYTLTDIYYEIICSYFS